MSGSPGGLDGYSLPPSYSAFMVRCLPLPLRGWAHVVLAGLLLLLVACGGSGGGSGSSNPTVTLDRIEIVTPSVLPSSSPNSFPKGMAVSLTVVGHFSNGSSSDFTSLVTWASSDPAVILVDGQGAVQFAEIGTATVTVTLSDGNPISGQIDLTVTAPALLDIQIQPFSVSMPAGVVTSFTASGRFTDGSSSDITNQVTWSVSQPAVAEIAATGLATGLTPGNTTVTASLDGQSGSAVLTVTNATLLRIEVTPAQLSLPQGLSQELTATGVYSDDSSARLDAQTVQWVTADADIASVNPSGLLTGLSPGPTTVSATFGGITGSTTLEVTTATLEEITITPASPALAAGSELVLTAMGLFSDSSSRDLSTEVSWSVAEISVATVQLDVDTGKPRLAGQAAGQTVLQATLGNITDSATVQVKSSTLTAIRITPTDFSMAVGRRVQLKATGNFNDGASQRLDTQVDWNSTDGAVANVDGQGRLTALAPGSVRISARQGNIVDSVQVTVTNASLQSLVITPADFVLAKGTNQVLEAHGLYDDDSNVDLSSEVVWQSDAPTIARIDNDDANRGRLMALTAGDAIISAALGGVSAQTEVEVSNAIITGLAITSATTTLLRGLDLNLTATASFDDGSTQDVTGQAVWSLSGASNNLASVSNVPGLVGRVTGLAAGNVTVSASLLGQTAGIDLSVVDDPLAPVSLTAVATPNVILSDGNNGTTLIITVLAAGATSTVPDGTLIDLDVIEGRATLSAPSVTTANGMASVSLNSTTLGLVTVRATIAITDVDATIANVASLRVTDSFENALDLAAFANTEINNGQLAAGARFGVFLSNFSNRTFSINEFRFLYDTAVVLQLTDPAILNGSALEGGDQIGIIVRTNDSAPVADLTAIYSLSDAPTGESFEGGVRFQLN